MIFDSFLSNEENKARILRLCESGRLPHAILLEGERGSGRFLFARMLAAAAVCRRENAGCGVCPDCRMALENRHPDVEVYQKGGERTLAISSLREIIRGVATPPVQGRHRVVILRDIQDAAQIRTLNALLKVIEEPPDYLMFVITADSRDNLLPTIVSRCMTMRITLPDVESCAREAARLAGDVSEEEALRCAKLSRGNIGRCVLLLTDTPEARAMRDAERIRELLLTVEGRYEILLILHRYERDRAGYRELLRCLQEAFASCLTEGTSAQDEAEGTARRVTARQGLHILQALSLCADEGRQNLNLPLALTQLCARLYAAVDS